jgi:hypothetical protein
VNRVSRSYAKRKTTQETANRRNGNAEQVQVYRSAGL